MNNFQTILVAIFLAFFVFGVLIFSGIIKIGGSKTGLSAISGKVVVWGVLPSSDPSIANLFEGIGGSNASFTVDYVKQEESTYQNNLIEAFAKGQGPDLFILTPDMILKNSSFLYEIPYNSLPEKSFRSLYIDGADILLSKQGVMGYPMLVDPMVLYYNKNLLTNQSILYPPAYWDELFNLGSKLIVKQSDGVVNQSMIALGQYDNVNHAKDILALLLLQGGNNIIERTDSGYDLRIKNSTSLGDYSLEQIVNFFLEFSNPSKESYTWNRSLPNSLDMFASGKLAFYLGYASELFKIEAINPNLSFDVTNMLQTKGTNIKRTYGNFYILGINKNSKNLASAFGVSSLIMENDFLKELSILVSLPTASRSILNEKQQEPYLSTFFDSAIVSRSWLDPDKESTNLIFKDLIESSLSNRLSVAEAVDKAYSQINLILNKYEKNSN